MIPAKAGIHFYPEKFKQQEFSLSDAQISKFDSRFRGNDNMRISMPF